MPSRISTSVLAAAMIAGAFSTAAPAAAQAPAREPAQWELRLPGGMLVPTGEQRRALGDAHVTALQVSRVGTPRFAVTGSFAWARSRDLATVDAPKVDVFTTDLGVEARSDEKLADGPVGVSLFGGVGMGVRSYNHRGLTADATHNLIGYGSVGAELGMGRVGVRLEVRDYVGGFKPLIGPGPSQLRNDVVMTVALRFNRARPSQGQE